MEWDDIAEVYDAIAGKPGDIVYKTLGPALWDSIGDVQDMTVLDLGCGSGWLSEMLSQVGARVVGIDASSALLERAKTRSSKCRWILHDLSTGLPDLPPIHLVVSNMVLMDFDPIEPVVRDLAQLLMVGSRIVVTMPHPAFFNYPTGKDGSIVYRKVSRYLLPQTWRIESYGGHSHYHRPLSHYVNLFGDHGFVLKRFHEPEHKDEIPVFCLLEWVRISA